MDDVHLNYQQMFSPLLIFLFQKVKSKHYEGAMAGLAKNKVPNDNVAHGNLGIKITHDSPQPVVFMP